MWDSLYIPPHSSNQIQPLDLCVFGVIKRLITRLNKMDQRNIQSVHVGKLVPAFHSSCNPVNDIAPSETPGLCCNWNQLVSRSAMLMSINATVSCTILRRRLRQSRCDNTMGIQMKSTISQNLSSRSGFKFSSKRLHRCWERTNSEIQLNAHSHPFVVLSRYCAFFYANRNHRTPLKNWR
jgi:hypothetical protein